MHVLYMYVCVSSGMGSLVTFSNLPLAAFYPAFFSVYFHAV